MNWLKRVFARRGLYGDLSAEIREHLEEKIEELVAEGMPRKEAEAKARREFGNVTLLEERGREVWQWPRLESFFADVRYGLRMLRKSPGFTTVAVLTIALGVGATTAIFSVVDATLLNALPYSHPEQLVRIVDDLPGVGAKDVRMSVPEWQDLQRSGIFQYVSPDYFADTNLTGSSQPERIRLLGVAPNYFALVGAKPELGRTFNPEDRTPGFLMEAVISDGLWKRGFGGDPHVLDRSMRLDNDSYRIIGVMPPDYHDPGRTTQARNIDVWAAVGFAAAPFPSPPLRNARLLPGAIARLKPGLTVAAAQSQVDALVASLQKQFPDAYPAQSAWIVRLTPLKESVVGDVQQSLFLLLGAVGLVLLIGCVNVANLLLARGSARGREMAIRQALGAARGRLMRQLLTEGLSLSLVGGIAGLAILTSLKGLLLRLVPDSLPRLNHISISWSVLAFALVASVAAGVIFGLAPSLHAGRLDLIHALKQEGRGATGSGEQARTRQILVVTEFALSLVLLVAASLLLHSFWELLHVQPGFNPQNVMAVRMWLPVPNDPKTDIYGSVAQEATLVRELLRRSATLPGVEEVALGNRASIPLGHGKADVRQFPLIFEGRDAQGNQPFLLEGAAVTPGYFHLLRIPLLQGRLFDDSDNEKAPQIAIINQALARTYWRNENPLGKRFRFPAAGSPWITVAGVISDTRLDSLDAASVPEIYLSLYQTRAKDLAIFLRGHLNTGAIPGLLREQVQSVNPTLPVFGAQTLNQSLSTSLADRRFSMQVVALFALTALLLAALGIYGVISYVVNERTHEFGVRRALGAQSSDILGMVLRQGLKLAIAGAGIGLIGALVVSRLMSGLLYGVTATDPVTFAGVAVLLAIVALAACWIPARRAMRVDPMVALRYE